MLGEYSTEGKYKLDTDNKGMERNIEFLGSINHIQVALVYIQSALQDFWKKGGRRICSFFGFGLEDQPQLFCPCSWWTTQYCSVLFLYQKITNLSKLPSVF